LAVTVPPTTIVLFRADDGSTPFLDWFDRLPEKAKVQCRARLGLLSQQGHELRRPAADFFFATRFRPAAAALPERATVRLRLLVRAPFRFAITRSFRNASEPRLTLTVPGK